MTFVNFLMADSSAETLDDFAKKFFHSIGAQSVSERHSANYTEGRYFYGTLDSCEVVLALSDELDFDDLNFWVSLEALSEDCISNFETIIHSSLITKGVLVAKIENFGKKNMSRLDY